MDVVISFFGQAFYFFMEYIMHFDRYIPMVMEQYGVLIYVLLFLIIFCETGLVVTPFLPGDSLLFACGALSAASATSVAVKVRPARTARSSVMLFKHT